MLAQGVVAFESEWRVFVLRGEVVGIGHYHGDPLRFPDGRVIQEMLQAQRDPVAAYRLDVVALLTCCSNPYCKEGRAEHP